MSLIFVEELKETHYHELCEKKTSNPLYPPFSQCPRKSKESEKLYPKTQRGAILVIIFGDRIRISAMVEVGWVVWHGIVRTHSECCW